VIARLSGEINRALAAPDVRASLAERGVDVRAGTPGEFASFLAAERAKWSRAVKQSGATVD
jgi:tripartite-type tricarboxylate transporter receptor subunit TctC